jgi:hypothetical protein
VRRHEGPVLIDDSGDVGFFLDAGSAERYLEPWCVEYGMAAYDAEGRRLHIDTSSVTLHAPEGPAEPDAAFQEKLRAFLVAVADRLSLDAAWLGRAPFADLVRVGLARLGRR